ncbi:aldo/keto reductase [uncultured Draconibacterium sp.]|uniref:aldo/keto reductase n=1 Tax=uncultured Draconibacterium sp. TaxID=1573823 RepID=UPI0029C07223|nr:aldo/keto reductase [uncultured Draconibacterium sp.]
MEKLNIKSTVELANGVQMPRIGLGVFQSADGNEVINAIKYAVEAGYGLIDTAAIYNNEAGVGEAIKSLAIPREQLFITSKVWNSDQGYESTLKAFDVSMEKLGLDVLDMYLIHWPVKGKYNETWRAMEKLYANGKVRAIGVSNFLQHQLEDLISNANIVPMLNQVEYHPYLTQPGLANYCKQNKILLQAWAPLMQGKIFEVDEIKLLAEKHGKSPAHIVIRWNLQKGILTIPKSVKKHRIEDNVNVFDFELTEEDMAIIDNLNRSERLGPDPDNFDF